MHTYLYMSEQNPKNFICRVIKINDMIEYFAYDKEYMQEGPKEMPEDKLIDILLQF